MKQLLFSLLAMSSALIGTFIVLKFSEWSRKHSILLIGFAAGVMLSIIIPVKRKVRRFISACFGTGQMCAVKH